MSLWQRRREERGTTLVEVVVSSAVLLIVVGATLAVFESAARTERNQSARVATLDDLRTTMNRLTKELRQASAVTAVSSTSRIDMHTYLNGTEADIVYEISGDVLTRRVDGGAVVEVLTGVDPSSSFCYDPPICSAVTPSTTPSSVVVILSAQPDASAAQPLTLEMEVKLRNVASS